MANAVVLVSSCFKYHEFWKPFFYFFNRAWPDCPYVVYLGTDTGSYANIPTINTGKDFGWATNTRLILNTIKEEYIVLLLEDYFLESRPIDTKKIQEYIDHMEQHKIGCLRLFPCPGPNRPWPHHKELGLVDQGEQYRVSLQQAIWSKKTLLSLIRAGESIWEM